MMNEQQLFASTTEIKRLGHCVGRWGGCSWWSVSLIPNKVIIIGIVEKSTVSETTQAVTK